MRPPLLFLDDAARSPDPAVCPFFRFEHQGDLVAPLHQADAGNRCAAIGAPRPQSARQQELVCLTSAHADCPRYLRGSMALQDPEAASRTSTVPRATLAAILVLVLSAGISFGFVVQRGGIELPAAGTTPTSTAIALAPEPSETPFVEPSDLPTDAASADASVEPVVSPSDSPSPSPSASPSPTPSRPRHPRRPRRRLRRPRSPRRPRRSSPRPSRRPSRPPPSRPRSRPATATSCSRRVPTSRTAGSTRSARATTSTASATTSGSRPA